MMKSLEKKVAVITGAGHENGIGYASAIKLASLGATIAIIDIEFSTKIYQEYRANRLHGSVALVLKADISKKPEIYRSINTIVEEFGSVDILVNNAGTTIGSGPFLDIDEEHFDLSYSINTKAAALLSQTVIPLMRERGGGAIVNNASIAGLGVESGFGAYSMSKHALVALTKAVAAEFGADKIRCNAVCPGYVSTDMHEQVNIRLAREQSCDIDHVRHERYSAVALHRAGTAAEIAEIIAFLASPSSSYLTGIALSASGGTPVGL